ncbi:hypothetical protein D918_09199 [Trichuris suis]|nr:hypothetical protein D918_09199 [Trichuris suis]
MKRGNEDEVETKTAQQDYEQPSLCLEWLAQLSSLSRDQLIRKFRDEYVSLPGPPCLSMITQFWANSLNDKNRYRDIPCLDKTRVHLRCPGNDYIHANWIDSPEIAGRIIMTQAPKENTARDFWSMVVEVSLLHTFFLITKLKDNFGRGRVITINHLQEKVNLIVALTKVEEKGVEKSFAYWPMEMGPKAIVKFQNYVIRKTGHQKVPGCTISILEVTNTDKNQRLKVKHLLYLDWPDHRVPKCTHRFMALVKLCAQLMNHPISLTDVNVTLIHCSAGVGRSGTLVALLMLSNAVDKGLAPNVKNTVKCLREQRALAVQGLEQYAFIYRAVMELIWVKEDMSEEVQTNTQRQIDLLRTMTTKSRCDLNQLKPRNILMCSRINLVEDRSGLPPRGRSPSQTKGTRKDAAFLDKSQQAKRKESGLQAIKNMFSNTFFQKGRRKSRPAAPLAKRKTPPLEEKMKQARPRMPSGDKLNVGRKTLPNEEKPNLRRKSSAARDKVNVGRKTLPNEEKPNLRRKSSGDKRNTRRKTLPNENKLCKARKTPPSPK